MTELTVCQCRPTQLEFFLDTLIGVTLAALLVVIAAKLIGRRPG